MIRNLTTSFQWIIILDQRIRMSLEQKSKSELSEWLDNTQRESWQLELIFSGFVIFLLLAGLEPYHALGEKINHLEETSTGYFIFFLFIYHIFRIALYILTIAIMIHVFLRGLWISTIGLRSVSGDIEWKEIKISSRFENYLKKKIPSFDSYIDKIEEFCSISFAFTFLMLFSVLAAGAFFICLLFIQILFQALLGVPLFTSTQGFQNEAIPMLTFVFLGLIYLIDFISLGWIKKINWLSPIYYPIYRFFGFITFANFYRPIYYNLIDNKLGRKLVMLIFPLSLLVVVLMSIRYVPNAYMPYVRNGSTWYAYDRYEATAKDQTSMDRPSINSQVISDNHLKLFVPYLPSSHDETIKHLCPDLEPGYFTGVKLRGGFSAGKISNTKSSNEALLDCMKQLWIVELNDSIYTSVNFRFYEHPLRNQSGLLSIIPIHHLDHSEHYIKINKPRFLGDTITVFEGQPLWFYKE